MHAQHAQHAQHTNPWLLINICTCCIVTTSIVSKLITFSLIKDEDYEEDFDRNLKAFLPFALLELVAGFVYAICCDGVLPLVILALGWFVSSIGLFFNFKLAYDQATVENETFMRRANVLRLVIWLVRFIVLFVIAL